MTPFILRLKIQKQLGLMIELDGQKTAHQENKYKPGGNCGGRNHFRSLGKMNHRQMTN